MSQSKPFGSPERTRLAIIGLVLVAILSLGYAGYSALNPHQYTVTQQQLVATTQSVNAVQTQTVVSTSTQTSLTTPGASNNANPMSDPTYCNFYGCFTGQGCGYTPCQLQDNNTVHCYGYLYDGGNECIQLAVWTEYPAYYHNGIAYVHYQLRNLPSSYPPIGSWVHVTGQLYLGNDTMSGMSGASCPSSYITVSSITL